MTDISAETTCPSTSLDFSIWNTVYHHYWPGTTVLVKLICISHQIHTKLPVTKRFNCSLKQPLRYHNKPRWTETLPLELLGLRSALKRPKVYRRRTGVLFNTQITTKNSLAISNSGRIIRVYITSQKHHEHTLLRMPDTHGGVKKPLQPYYDGPYAAIERTRSILPYCLTTNKLQLASII